MILGQAGGLVRSIWGPAKVCTRQNGCVIFSVQHHRAELEEKANTYAELDLRWKKFFKEIDQRVKVKNKSEPRRE